LLSCQAMLQSTQHTITERCLYNKPLSLWHRTLWLLTISICYCLLDNSVQETKEAKKQHRPDTFSPLSVQSQEHFIQRQTTQSWTILRKKVSRLSPTITFQSSLWLLSMVLKVLEPDGQLSFLSTTHEMSLRTSNAWWMDSLTKLCTHGIKATKDKLFKRTASILSQESTK